MKKKKEDSKKKKFNKSLSKRTPNKKQIKKDKKISKKKSLIKKKTKAKTKPKISRRKEGFFGKIRAELFGNKKPKEIKNKKSKISKNKKLVSKNKKIKLSKTKVKDKEIKKTKTLPKKTKHLIKTKPIPKHQEIQKTKPIIHPQKTNLKYPKDHHSKPIEPKKGFFGKIKTSLLGTKEEENPDKKIKKVVKQLKTEIHKKDLKRNNGEEVKSPKETEEKEPVLTGIKGFDALFGKGEGMPSGASVLVEGGPGSGKTLFCLTTLYNLCKNKGKKCLYMSFEEPEERLIHHMENFGWDAKGLIKKGLLRIKRFDAIDVSRSIEALLGAAKKELLIDIDPVFFPEDFDADFVVIDSLTSIASAFSGEDNRFRIYMEQLFRYLERNKITNLLIREVSAPSHVGSTFKEEGSAVSFLSDGIIVIYNVIYDSGERTSAIEILKMRGVDFQRKLVELKIIDKKGLEVNPNKVLKKHKGKGFSLT